MGIKAITGAGLLFAGPAAGPGATTGTQIVITVAPARIDYPRPRPYSLRTVWIPGHRVVQGGGVRVSGRWAPRGRAWVRRGGYWNRRGAHDRDGWRH